MEDKFVLITGGAPSSWSLRAWLILKQIGVKFVEQQIDLSATDFKLELLKYSPSGKVPALIHNDKLIWDSLAIAEYLNELFPEVNLWNYDSYTRAFARSISCEMHSGFQTLRQTMPFTKRTDLQVSMTDELALEIKRIENIWCECRAKFSQSGEYLFGEFSIADAMFAPIVLRFRSYNYHSNNDVVQDYSRVILHNKYITEWISRSVI